MAFVTLSSLSLRAYKIAVFGLFALIAFMHAAGFQWSLYFYYWWYDIIMHLLGGLAVALLTGYVFFLRRRKEDMPARRQVLITTFVSIAIIGILWEIFEFAVDQYFILHGFDALDTMGDLVNDTIGAYAGMSVFVAFSKKYLSNKINETAI